MIKTFSGDTGSSGKDANIGAGYGTIRNTQVGKDYTTQSIYPYHEKLSMLSDYDSEDEDTFEKIAKKIDMSNIAKPATTGRTDRSTFTKMRLDIHEATDTLSAMQGMVPFPFSKLYKKFSGPPMGGFRTDAAYTTGPGRSLRGTTHGWSKAPDAVNDDGSEFSIYHINDMIDPALKAIVKTNLTIKNNQKKSNNQHN